MAGTFSNYLEKALQDEVLGGVAYVSAATVYFALLTDTNTPTQRDANTVTEVSTATWTNYQRAPMTNNTTNFPAVTLGAALKNNAVAITAFLSSGTTIAASASVTINAVAIYDAAAAGNLLIWFDLSAPKVVANGDIFQIPINSMAGTLD